MINFRIIILLSLFFYVHIKTMEVDAAENKLSSDPCLILRLICQRVESFSHDDVMSMLLVHKNMATILTQTADIRIEWLKKEIQKIYPKHTFNFNAVAFHSFGCSAAWLERMLRADGNRTYVNVCSIWANVDNHLCTTTEVVHGYCGTFNINWIDNYYSYIKITESERSYITLNNPKYKNGTFVVCAYKVFDGNSCTTKIIINQNFIKQYKALGSGSKFYVGAIQ